MMTKKIWITWEYQRRSVELAGKLGCELYILEYYGLLRYPKSIFRTMFIIFKAKPKILFVQNPSMILATCACFYKIFSGISIIVDRHTTFNLNDKENSLFYILIHKLLSRFTIQYADMTIVTNDYLAQLVKTSSGIPFVLPDKIPELYPSSNLKLKGKYNILSICSYNKDEPIAELFEAMSYFGSADILLYLTGNYKKLDEPLYTSVPSNVVLTGFLKEQEFVNMLFSVDIIIVLTTADYCMLCGCYEALSACKPLITSDKKVLREYFTDALFVDNTAKGIADGIKQTVANIETYRRNICNLKNKLMTEWEEKFKHLENELSILN